MQRINKNKLDILIDLNKKATIEIENDNYEKAKEFLERALEIDPDYFDINYNMGNLYYKLENRLEAIRYYLYSINLKYNDRNAIINMCCALIELEKDSIAESLINSYLEENPKKIKTNLLKIFSFISSKNQTPIDVTTKLPFFESVYLLNNNLHKNITIVLDNKSMEKFDFDMIKYSVEHFWEKAGFEKNQYHFIYDKDTEIIKNYFKSKEIKIQFNDSFLNCLEEIKTKYVFYFKIEQALSYQINFDKLMYMMEKYPQNINTIFLSNENALSFISKKEFLIKNKENIKNFGLSLFFKNLFAKERNDIYIYKNQTSNNPVLISKFEK